MDAKAEKGQGNDPVTGSDSQYSGIPEPACFPFTLKPWHCTAALLPTPPFLSPTSPVPVPSLSMRLPPPPLWPTTPECFPHTAPNVLSQSWQYMIHGGQVVNQSQLQNWPLRTCPPLFVPQEQGQACSSCVADWVSGPHGGVAGKDRQIG